MIEAYEYRLIADFLGENWSDFTESGNDCGYTESELNDLINKLEAKANG